MIPSSPASRSTGRPTPLRRRTKRGGMRDFASEATGDDGTTVGSAVLRPRSRPGCALRPASSLRDDCGQPGAARDSGGRRRLTVAPDLERPSTPYPAYKDSGVEWLERVPAHFEVRRLGQIGVFFKCSGGTKADDVPAGLPTCIRYGHLYTQFDQLHRARSVGGLSPEACRAVLLGRVR